MRKASKTILILLLLGLVFPYTSFAVSAKNHFNYSAWIPFWKKQSGVPDTSSNITKLTEINPFSYEVNSNGVINGTNIKIKQDPWPQLFAEAKAAKTWVIPTIAWFDSAPIMKVLSNSKLRKAHEDAIVKLVKDNGYDGIDIDYENKPAESKAYFSLFLKELAAKFPTKILSCTIEPRTPLADKFKVIPKDVQFANDFVAINKYCDEVKMMAYDQGDIDIKLNASKGTNDYYIPVADKDWDAKVMAEALKSISRKKLMLGIPTYGYEWEIGRDLYGAYAYDRIRSVSFFQAMQVVEATGILPQRNSAGELSFSYTTSTVSQLANVGSTIQTPVKRIIWFSDAVAVADKIALAKKLGLRGVAFFKMDGESDPLIWDKIK